MCRMLCDKLDHLYWRNIGAQSVCKILHLYRGLLSRLSGNILITAIIPFYNKNSVMHNFINLLKIFTSGQSNVNSTTDE